MKYFKSKKIKYLKVVLVNLLVLLILLTPVIVMAQGSAINVTFKNPTKVNSIHQLVKVVLDVIIKIGAVVVVFMIIFTGFKFVTAQGNEQKISEAKTSFFWTLIGAVILLGAQVLSEVVCNTARQFDGSIQCIIR